MPEKLYTLLSIAGSDPMGGAGIQADVKAGTCLGLHVVTAITAVTSQNSKGLKVIGSVTPELLISQLSAIFEDVTPNAVKIGMIGSITNMKVISEFLKKMPDGIPVITDPLLKTSRGDNDLYDDGSHDFLNHFRNLIMPFSTVITPNENEAKILFNQSKIQPHLIQEILNSGGMPGAVVLTGCKEIGKLTDFLVTRDKIESNSHAEIECKNLHGTGCVYSSFLASYLALGYTLTDAFDLACKKMQDTIVKSCNYKLGSSDYGPLNINHYHI